MTTFFAIALVLAATAIVGWPLLKRPENGEQLESIEDTETEDLLLQKESTFFAIGELDSDYAMGNLSSKDYEELRRKYEQKAVSIMKDVDDLQSRQDDEIEQEVLRLRGRTSPSQQEAGLTCAGCGASLDPANSFCPECGAAVSLTCPNCGARAESDQRFCAECGTRLERG